MRKAIVPLVLLLIPVFALGMLACSDNDDDDLMRSNQSLMMETLHWRSVTSKSILIQTVHGV